MASTHTKLLYPLVFSTKHRSPLITAELRPHLYYYVGGIIRNHNGVLGEIDCCESMTSTTTIDICGTECAWAWCRPYRGFVNPPLAYPGLPPGATSFGPSGARWSGYAGHERMIVDQAGCSPITVLRPAACGGRWRHTAAARKFMPARP